MTYSKSGMLSKEVKYRLQVLVDGAVLEGVGKVTPDNYDRITSILLDQVVINNHCVGDAKKEEFCSGYFVTEGLPYLPGGDGELCSVYLVAPSSSPLEKVIRFSGLAPKKAKAKKSRTSS